EEPQMIDLRRDARVGFKLPRGLRLQTVRQTLHKLNQHSIRVRNLKGVVAGTRLPPIARLDVEALRTQIDPHRLDIVNRETQMAHHIGRMSRRFVEELDMLMVVNLDKSDANVGTVLLRQG